MTRARSMKARLELGEGEGKVSVPLVLYPNEPDAPVVVEVDYPR